MAGTPTSDGPPCRSRRPQLLQANWPARSLVRSVFVRATVTGAPKTRCGCTMRTTPSRSQRIQHAAAATVWFINVSMIRKVGNRSSKRTHEAALGSNCSAWIRSVVFARSRALTRRGSHRLSIHKRPANQKGRFRIRSELIGRRPRYSVSTHFQCRSCQRTNWLKLST